MDDEDLLPISALEHLLYCPRQCALIHIDGVWVENAHTTAGKLLHERVDRAEEERRPGVVLVRSALLRCERLGLKGIADAVESSADIFSSLIVWGGLRIASRQADEM